MPSSARASSTGDSSSARCDDDLGVALGAEPVPALDQARPQLA